MRRADQVENYSEMDRSNRDVFHSLRSFCSLDCDSVKRGLFFFKLLAVCSHVLSMALAERSAISTTILRGILSNNALCEPN